MVRHSTAINEAAATGDAKVGYVFYNYHSVTLPRSGIENLIKFVTSQLALTLLRFFFCCDMRHTPADVIRLMEDDQNCEVMHISNQSPSCFEEEISRRALDTVAGIESGLLVLVTDEGNYELLFDELGDDWDLGIFHPADTDPAFHNLAEIAIQLPIDKESPEPIGSIYGQMNELKRDLMKVLERIKEINKMEMEPLKKVTDYVVAKSKEVEKKVEEDVKDESVEDSKEEEEKEDEEEEVKTDPMPKGLGWDSFPADPGLKTSGWDEEVSKEVEAEKAWRNAAASPSPFASPPQQEKKNPFGGNPFETKSKPSTPKMSSPPAAARAPSYNHHHHQQQDHFQQRSLHEEANYMGDGPFGGYQQQQPQHQPYYHKEARNPFGGGGGGPTASSSSKPGGPNFKKPGPQCPQWEDRVHRAADKCALWHPFKQCMFYPMCRMTAVHCGYAHPFCTDGECQCGQVRDPQLNHFELNHFAGF